MSNNTNDRTHVPAWLDTLIDALELIGLIAGVLAAVYGIFVCLFEDVYSSPLLIGGGVVIWVVSMWTFLKLTTRPPHACLWV